MFLIGKGAAYLLIGAVFVVIYGAGANKDVCAAGVGGKKTEEQSGNIFKHTNTSMVWLIVAGTQTGSRPLVVEEPRGWKK